MGLRLLIVLLLAGIGPAPARAQGTELVPGVTYEKIVQFTPHGAVALHVITAPRPGDQNGLYQLAPVLGRGTVLGPREKVTQLEKDVSAQATVAGINGDLWNQTDGHPAGIVMSGGVLEHPPLAGRSSIGVDAAGSLHVDRVRFFGTWRGTGQRRPLSGVNQTPASGQVVLFTPAYGAAVPQVAGSAEAILEPFPAATANSDLTASVTAAGAEGGQQIPPDGAVLMSTGTTAAKLAAEAPVGTPLTIRLILQPAWDGVGSALGGGPVLVRNGKAVFRSLEDFTNEQIAGRDARAGIGQLADGRIVLVAVDGGQPGYSVGMTSFELAQTMQRLGAVTAAGVESGGAVTAAFDAQLLSRPADTAGERAVREALLVEYFGVYVPPLPLPLLNGDASRSVEPLSYKLVRPSTVTAALVGPDGVARVLENNVAHTPGSYSLPFQQLDAEGGWHWRVQATDDLGRTSVADRPFRYDTTLKGLAVPAVSHGQLTVRFTLARPAKVRLRIETRTGVTMRDLAPATLAAGPAQVVWDGRLPQGTRAYGGTYVAHVFVSSTVGTSDLAVPFAFRRGA